MKSHPVTACVIVSIALLLVFDPGQAWSQQSRKQRQRQQQQQQQILQRALQQSAGAAGAFAPNIGTDRPMEGALWGQGGELQNAIQDASRQLKAKSGNAISADRLAQALPPAIGEYRRTELILPPPEDQTGVLSGISKPATVSATYRNPAEQTLTVRLTDIGLMLDMSPSQSEEKTESAVQTSESGDTVFMVKEIQGIDAKIYYDRIQESGNLMMNANRVSVSIDGRNIPFAMLEMSAAELKVDELAKLGG